MNYEFDWRGAERELERAIELNPSYPIAHQFYGGCLLQQGRVEEGLQEVKRSLGLDPLSLALNWYWGMTLSYARRYDEAIEQLRKTIQMEPNYFLAHSGLGGAYLQKRLYAEAISEFQTAAKLRPGTDEATSLLAYAYAVSGNRREAQRKLYELKVMPASSDNNNRPLQIAKVYAALGDKDQAIEWLEKAYERRAFGMFFLKVDPGFDTLRSDERFKEWLRRIGLTP